jgi:hypothetical protein
MDMWKRFPEITPSKPGPYLVAREEPKGLLVSVKCWVLPGFWWQSTTIKILYWIELPPAPPVDSYRHNIMGVLL